MSTSKQKQKNEEIKADFKQKIQKLLLINEIIDKNISQDSLHKITKKDLYIYEIFILSSPNIIYSMALITKLPNKFFFFEGFNISQNYTKFVIISITFLIYNTDIISENYFNIFKHIFSFSAKLFHASNLEKEDLIFILKYALIISTINTKSNTLYREDKPINKYFIFYLIIEILLAIKKKENRLNTANDVINNVVLFIAKKTQNKNTIEKLSIYSNLLSLISIAYPLNKKNIINLLTEVYTFKYNKFFLDVFISNYSYVFDLLAHSDKSLASYFSILSSQWELIANLEEKERKLLQKDPYIINNAFMFNDSLRNGIDFKINYDILKKTFTIVFGFKIFENQKNIEYPLITFYNLDKKKTSFKLSIKQSKLILTAKNVCEIINIDVSKTYLVVIEYEKGNWLSNPKFTISINDDNPRVFDNQIEAGGKYLMRVGYEETQNNINRNFVGTIGTVIFMKRKMGEDFSHNIRELKGKYDKIMMYTSNTNYEQFEQYSTRNSISESVIEYFIKNASLFEDSLCFTISPLSILQNNNDIENEDEDENTKIFRYKENIYNRHAKEIFIENYYILREHPIHDKLCTYPIIYNNVIEQFLKYEGISLMTLNLELVYNVMRRVIDGDTIIQNDSINKDLLCNCIISLLKVAKIALTNCKFKEFAKEFGIWGFSLAKTIALMEDENMITESLYNELISVLEPLIMYLSKGKNDSNEITIFSCKYYTFLCDIFKYHLDNYDLLFKLFRALHLFTQKNESIISTHTFKYLLLFCNILDSNDENRKINYKPSRREYKGLLRCFISKCVYDQYQSDIINIIFEKGSNISMKIKYRLLKILYLSRPESFQCSFQNSNFSISTENNNKSSSSQKQKKDKSFSSSNSSDECKDVIIKYQSIMNSLSLKGDKDCELIKAILIQLIVESNYNISGEIHTSLENSNLSYNSADKIPFSSFSYTKSKTPLSLNVNKKLSFQSDITSKNNSQKNVFFQTAYVSSFYVIKSYFALGYEGIWGAKTKISFIKSFDPDKEEEIKKFDFIFDEFNRNRKEIMILYANISLKIEDNELRRKNANLISLFISNSINAYIKNENFKCQFIHIFESSSLMNSLITAVPEIKENLLFSFQYIFINHPNSFIFDCIANMIHKNKFLEASTIIISLCMICSEYNLKKENKVERKIIFSNENHLIKFLRALAVNEPDSMLNLSKQNYFNDYVTKMIMSAIKSIYIYDFENEHFINIIDFIFDFSMSSEGHIISSLKMLSALISSKHTVCFYYDLLNTKIEFNQKTKISLLCELDNIEEINEFLKKPKKDCLDIRLATLYTFIKCIAYSVINCENKGFEYETNLFPDIISQLQVDVSELISLIEKFPKKKKRFSEFDDLYEKNLKFLFKNKDEFNLFEIEKIIVGDVKIMNKKKKLVIDVESDVYSKLNDSFSECKNNCGETNNNIVVDSQKSNYNSEKNIKRDYPKNIFFSLFDFDDYAITCIKRDLLLREFGVYFSEKFFENEQFILMKKFFHSKYKISDPKSGYHNQNKPQNLSYPTIVKNYSFFEEFYPKMFLRPDTKFFYRDLFKYGHQYFPAEHRLIAVETTHGLLNQQNFNFFGKKKFFKDVKDKAKNIFYECEYCSSHGVIYGIICLREKNFIFQTIIPFDVKKEYLSKSKYAYSSLEVDVSQVQKQIIVQINQIDTIIIRRFLYRNQALEIFLKNGKNYFFNFFSLSNLSSFISKITELSNLKVIDDPLKTFNKLQYTLKWKEGCLSNFDYLLQINKYSSRTYNDINQYPVFPWVIIGFDTSNFNNYYRNFSLAVSVQKEEAQARAKERYENSLIGKFRCHFQIHYSNSSFVNSYLVRMAPFTYNQIKFQNLAFDNPNRQFHSFEEYSSLMMEVFDNREMIPEMYLMMEHFLNLNFVDFGKRTIDQVLINNMRGNKIGNKAISFILSHRAILEYNHVKENLSKWIDNIFGINQFVQDINSLNMFPRESYEQYIIPKFEKYEAQFAKDLDEKKLIQKIKGKCYAIISLGQTPKQIFNAIHPKGNTQKTYTNVDYSDINEEIHLKKAITIQFPKKDVLYIGITSKGNFVYILTRDEICKYSIELKEISSFHIEEISGNKSYPISSDNNQKEILIYKYLITDVNDGEFFLTCSHYGNSMNVYSNRSLTLKIITESFVTCVKSYHSKNLILSGHQNGKILIWKYEASSSFSVENERKILAHDFSVNIIEINNKHNLLISSGDEGIVILRKFSTFEILNLFNVKPYEIITDIHISIYDLIYLMIYNENKQKFIIVGTTLNFVVFEKTAHDYFLPFTFEKQNNEILYTFTKTFAVISKDLTKKKVLKNIMNSSNNKNSGVNENAYIVSFTYNTENNLLFCVLSSNKVIRMFLNSNF